jgi:hypothetical protein
MQLSWKKRQKKRSYSQPFLFEPPEIEIFPEAFKATIATPMGLYQVGQVKIFGQFWRAKLYELNCQTTLLVAQPVLVIGKEGMILIVVPYHCLLWNQYIDEFWPLLTELDISTMRRIERAWRTI